MREPDGLHKNLRYLVAVFLVAGIGAIWLFKPGRQMQPLPQTRSSDFCAEKNFENVSYIVCTVDTAKHDIGLSRLQPDGTPYRSLAKLADQARRSGRPLMFAMNAGMYHEDLSPVGLYVEMNDEKSPLNTNAGAGNFFLKPNGVFLVTRAGKAGVLTTEDYLAGKPEARFATQSGPMLVIDGRLHPKFEENGASRFIRNGVGVREDGTVMFAISKSEVSFGSFARLFRDTLDCPNALYFDGVVSAFSDGEATLVGGAYPAGPIVSVTGKDGSLTQ